MNIFKNGIAVVIPYLVILYGLVYVIFGASGYNEQHLGEHPATVLVTIPIFFYGYFLVFKKGTIGYESNRVRYWVETTSATFLRLILVILFGLSGALFLILIVGEPEHPATNLLGIFLDFENIVDVLEHGGNYSINFALGFAILSGMRLGYSVDQRLWKIIEDNDRANGNTDTEVDKRTADQLLLSHLNDFQKEFLLTVMVYMSFLFLSSMDPLFATLSLLVIAQSLHICTIEVTGKNDNCSEI